MTALENFQRMMTRQRPEWMPLTLQLTPPMVDIMEKEMGTRDAKAAFGFDFEDVYASYSSREKEWRAAFADIGFRVPANAEVGFAGITHAVPPAENLGQAYHLRQMLHPLEVITDVGQLSRLPWENIHEPAAYAWLPKAVENIHAEGRVAVGGLQCTIFEFSWYLRGMDNLYVDWAEENGISDWLLDWFTERSVICARAYCRAGCDVVFLGDDIGTQRDMLMSVEMWREHLKPRLKKVIDAVRATQTKPTWIAYHSDGNIQRVLPELIEIGVDILNPVQPECMPLDQVVAAYKDRLAFWGAIGTQTTLPFGSMGDIAAEVEHCADWVKRGAAFTISPTHVIEPDVPWANVLALVDAVKAIRFEYALDVEENVNPVGADGVQQGHDLVGLDANDLDGFACSKDAAI